MILFSPERRSSTLAGLSLVKVMDLLFTFVFDELLGDQFLCFIKFLFFNSVKIFKPSSLFDLFQFNQIFKTFK